MPFEAAFFFFFGQNFYGRRVASKLNERINRLITTLVADSMRIAGRSFNSSQRVTKNVNVTQHDLAPLESAKKF
ncbi:unnamed protein product [Ixodes pacificus]